MDFSPKPEHETIREAIGTICARFDDGSWLERDRVGGFAHALHRALADGGWLGVCPPQAYGGGGSGRAALQAAVQYAGERAVFDRPVGQKQSINHGWSVSPLK